MKCYAVTLTSAHLAEDRTVRSNTRISGVFDQPADAVEFLEFMALDGKGSHDLTKKLYKSRPCLSYAEWTSDSGWHHKYEIHELAVEIGLKEEN